MAKKYLSSMQVRAKRGLQYMGTGYLIEGTAIFEESGDHFELMKKRFDWIRAVLVVKPEKFEQTL